MMETTLNIYLMHMQQKPKQHQNGLCINGKSHFKHECVKQHATMGMFRPYR